jgi:hypothetical protein
MITGVIKDTSLLKMLEASITDGALYRFRDPITGGGDTDAMLELLFDFWEGVASVWPDEWGLPPRKSRLSHGAGIVALGYLLDAIVDRRARSGAMPDCDAFTTDLRLVAPFCRWTSGEWDFGMKWDEIQVVPGHIKTLTDFLLAVYRRQTTPISGRRTRVAAADRAA